MSEPEQVNPWPKRILWIGLAAMLGGMIGLFTQFGAISEVFDPRIAAHETIVGDSEKTVEIDSGCWIIFHESTVEGISVSVHLVEGGGGMSQEPINSTSCPDDLPAMSTDGTEFTRAGEWDFKEDSTVVILVDCAEDCAESEVYLMNYQQMESEFFSLYGLWAACGVCLLGIILVPLGGMIMMMNKGTGQNVVVMNTASSNLDPNDPKLAGSGVISTDEVFRRIKGAEKPELIEVENIPDPFVSGHSIAPKQKQIVEIEQVDADDTSWKEWDEC